MPANLTAFSQDAPARPVLTALAEGKWRKARDQAKDLCKKDKARYLPLLVEANVGLAREMISKGLTKDAEPVVAYLKTLASKEVYEPLVEALKAPPAPAAGGTHLLPGGGSPAAKMISLWAEVLKAAAALEAGGKPSPADWAAVDSAVACFTEPPESGDEDSLAARVALELQAVHKACDASAEGRWDEAQYALRSLPRQSVFQHWRMLLRGMRHVFHREKEEAKACFATLPADGACARAAVVMGGALGPGTTKKAPGAARAGWWLAVSGEPAAWAVPVAEADAAWKAGEWNKACQTLVKGLGGKFPTDAPGLAAVLSDFMFIMEVADTPLETRREDQMLDFWSRIAKNPGNAEATVLCLLRALLLKGAESMRPGELREEWMAVMALETKFHGPSPLRDCVGWQWLGEQLAKEDRSSRGMGFGFGFGGFGGREQPADRMLDAAGAVKAFQNAVKADPDSESAHLGLLSLLEKTGDKPERNRLLDDLVKRFPHNKKVMLQAGLLAAERKAFGKGLNYLRAARALDPLDREVRSALLGALVLQVRDLVKKKKDADAVWEEMEPMLTTTAGAGDYYSPRWTMRVRRALLDPDAKKAEAAAAEAGRLAPSPIEALALKILLRRLGGAVLAADWDHEWRTAFKDTPPGWRHAKSVLGMLVAHCEMKEWDAKAKRAADILLLDLIEEVCQTSLAKDPEGMLAYLDMVSGLKNRPREIFEQVLTDAQVCIIDGLRTLVQKGKADVRHRLAFLHLSSCERTFRPDAAYLAKIDKVITDAASAGLPVVADKARRLRQAMEKAGQDPDDDFLGDDGDDDWIDDLDAFEGDQIAEEFFQSAPPGTMALMAAILSGDPAEIEKAKKQALKSGIPMPFINQLIASAPKTGGGAKPGKKSGPGPDEQPELGLY